MTFDGVFILVQSNVCALSMDQATKYNKTQSYDPVFVHTHHPSQGVRTSLLCPVSNGPLAMVMFCTLSDYKLGNHSILLLYLLYLLFLMFGDV